MTAEFTERDGKAWAHGYSTGYAVGHVDGWSTGYVVGYDSGMPAGAEALETQLAGDWSEMKAHLRGVTTSPSHAEVIARRNAVGPVKPVPTGQVRLAADWDRRWLAGAPATRFLEQRQEVAA
ncbi:hypothetical protein [Cellulosimicrobium sp. I38E]|uniref:hypothetical protein n=1 Tax=Cellulosimicrobium sp. I38E TaxID=1393139 RepID=UPI0007B1F4C5|nr:hypothetical protein [Cellulosimicrobium sp. I38E]KZM78083.1 hypothetical protein A0J59_02705 [Cellulosimicrobium sp. I38E]